MITAQIPLLQFDHLRIEHGLPSNFAYTIYRDRTIGLVWISTDRGLCTYNGIEIKPFKSSNTQDSNLIVPKSFFEDVSHNLWLPCNNEGLYKLNLLTGELIKFSDLEPEVLPCENILIKDNFMYIASGEGLKRYDFRTKKITRYIHDPSDSTSAGQNGVPSMEFDSTGLLWLTFWDYSIANFDTKTEKFNHFRREEKLKKQCPGFNTWKIHFDPNRNILWGIKFYGDSLFSFDLSKKRFKIIPFNKYEETKPNYWDFALDKYGNLWFSTRRQGVVYYNPEKDNFQFITHDPKDKTSISDYRLNNLFIDSTHLWVTHINSGLSFTKLSKDLKKKYVFKDVYSNENKYVICHDGSTNVYLQDESKIVKIEYEKGTTFKLSGRYKRLVKTNINNTIYAIDFKNRLIEINCLTNKSRPLKNMLQANTLTQLNAIYQDSYKNYWILSFDKIYYAHKSLNNKPELKIDIQLPANYESKMKILQCDSTVIIHADLNIHLYKYKDKHLKYIDSLQYIVSKDILGVEAVYGKLKNDVFIGYTTKSKIYYDLHTKKKEVVPIPFFNQNDLTPKIEAINDTLLLATNYRGTFLVNQNTSKSFLLDFLSIENINPDELHLADANNAFVGCNNGLIHFNPIEEYNSSYRKLNILITKIQANNIDIAMDDLNKKWIYSLDTLYLTKEQSNLNIQLTLPNLEANMGTKYAHRLLGYDSDWIEIGSRNTISYTKLSGGTYILEYKATDRFGNKSKLGRLVIIKDYYYYETLWFYIGLFIFFIIIIYLLFKWRIYRVKMKNILLERIIRERTVEIIHQKEEILAQKDEIVKQQEKIQELYSDVTDSIQTAKRIQESILPDVRLIQSYLPNFSLYYKPKDIVSGDFYWFYVQEHNLYIAAVDCTGHGVAGAFMSLIASQLLNKIMSESYFLSPSDILSKLNLYVIQTLRQDTENPITKDGMDISLCKIDLHANMIEFSGANQSLYYFEPGCDLQIMKGNNNSIGIQPMGKISVFQNQVMSYKKDTTFFIFSDGYASQFGGVDGSEKYKPSRLRNFLNILKDFPFHVHSDMLEKEITTWSGDTEQTDDLMVISFRP